MAVRARGDEILVLNLVAYPGNTQSTDIAGRLCNGWADWMCRTGTKQAVQRV
jgi:hypothetical protein